MSDIVETDDSPKPQKTVVTEAHVSALNDETSPVNKINSQDPQQDGETVYVKGHPVIRNGNLSVFLLFLISIINRS